MPADSDSEEVWARPFHLERALFCFGSGQARVRFDSEAEFASLALVEENWNFDLERAFGCFYFVF